MLSDRLRQKVLQERSRGVRQYQIAHRARIHPTVLSALLSGAIPAKRNDPRILRLAEVLGVRESECFEEAPRA
jgi:hypothetical protein